MITALEMMEELEHFNEYRARHGLGRIEISIGINTGEVIAGYLNGNKSLITRSSVMPWCQRPSMFDRAAWTDHHR